MELTVCLERDHISQILCWEGSDSAKERTIPKTRYQISHIGWRHGDRWLSFLLLVGSLFQEFSWFPDSPVIPPLFRHFVGSMPHAGIKFLHPFIGYCFHLSCQSGGMQLFDGISSWGVHTGLTAWQLLRKRRRIAENSSAVRNTQPFTPSVTCPGFALSSLCKTGSPTDISTVYILSRRVSSFSSDRAGPSPIRRSFKWASFWRHCAKSGENACPFPPLMF